jgi:hypothetical protein
MASRPYGAGRHDPDAKAYVEPPYRRDVITSATAFAARRSGTGSARCQAMHDQSVGVGHFDPERFNVIPDCRSHLSSLEFVRCTMRPIVRDCHRLPYFVGTPSSLRARAIPPRLMPFRRIATMRWTIRYSYGWGTRRPSRGVHPYGGEPEAKPPPRCLRSLPSFIRFASSAR